MQILSGCVGEVDGLGLSGCVEEVWVSKVTSGLSRASGCLRGSQWAIISGYMDEFLVQNPPNSSEEPVCPGTLLVGPSNQVCNAVERDFRT